MLSVFGDKISIKPPRSLGNRSKNSFLMLHAGVWEVREEAAHRYSDQMSNPAVT